MYQPPESFDKTKPNIPVNVEYICCITCIIVLILPKEKCMRHGHVLSLISLESDKKGLNSTFFCFL